MGVKIKLEQGEGVSGEDVHLDWRTICVSGELHVPTLSGSVMNRPWVSKKKSQKYTERVL